MAAHLIQVVMETLGLLMDASVYVLLGLFISGMIRVCLSPDTITRHLGKDRYLSVLKAAFLGIPLPLCSCGVLPAAVSLRKQGANTGATTAFLISTPESGVDSIAITYALLDPIMTVARPVVAFLSAIFAGFSENFLSRNTPDPSHTIGAIFPMAAACGCDDGCGCNNTAEQETFLSKVYSGMQYAFNEVWPDIAVWFMAGMLIAGTISALVPQTVMSTYLGGGISAMLIMLFVSIPIYICATASTPIAAAMILKGASPGAALVFLIAGPATNITALTVLAGVLGKRACAIYLMAISLSAIASAIILDWIYIQLGISAMAAAGSAADIIPFSVKAFATVFLALLSIRPLFNAAGNLIKTIKFRFK